MAKRPIWLDSQNKFKCNTVWAVKLYIEHETGVEVEVYRVGPRVVINYANNNKIETYDISSYSITESALYPLMHILRQMKKVDYTELIEKHQAGKVVVVDVPFQCPHCKQGIL